MLWVRGNVLVCYVIIIIIVIIAESLLKQYWRPFVLVSVLASGSALVSVPVPISLFVLSLL